jgi:hypothetical protein
MMQLTEKFAANGSEFAMAGHSAFRQAGAEADFFVAEDNYKLFNSVTSR